MGFTAHRYGLGHIAPMNYGVNLENRSDEDVVLITRRSSLQSNLSARLHCITFSNVNRQ